MGVRSFDMLYVHLVWCTKYREPLIDVELEPLLHALVERKSLELGCRALAVGGVADHIHVLVAMATDVTVAALVNRIKGATSHAISHEFRPGMAFRWQRGYSVFSVNPRGVPRVRRYILRQHEHHGRGRLLAHLEPDQPASD